MHRADLHVHTRRSDGRLRLADVPGAAARAGVDVVAVTDHERAQPALGGPVVERHGVTLVAGIELRVEVVDQGVEAGDQRVDLLGYGLDPTPALRAELDRLQADRTERAARIVDRVESRLGVTLPLEPGPGVGRPHVARAIAAVTDHDVAWAFEHLIGADGPCYVARSLPTFERGRALLAESCRVVGLAHPLRYDDPDAALALAGDLDALEVAYPYEPAVDATARARVEAVREREDLLASGGTDAHGRRLGRRTLSGPQYHRFRDALGI